MTTQDKIDKAEERIKELNVLIYHWRNSIENTNHRELSLVEKSRSINNQLQAA